MVQTGLSKTGQGDSPTHISPLDWKAQSTDSKEQVSSETYVKWETTGGAQHDIIQTSTEDPCCPQPSSYTTL